MCVVGSGATPWSKSNQLDASVSAWSRSMADPGGDPSEVLRRLAAAMQAPNLFGELVAGMRKLRGDPPPPNVALLASLRLAASRQPSMAAGQRTGERGVANAGAACVHTRPAPHPPCMRASNASVRGTPLPITFCFGPPPSCETKIGSLILGFPDL